MDNDGDSTPNDQKIVDYLKKYKVKLLVASQMSVTHDEIKDSPGQPSAVLETWTRSCGIPK